ncbi:MULTISPECIES: glycoside hydrolase family 1 protein [unclassified Fusibacter]|uniref:glycoside hydrolase family 1 protein n=1 Tax=unclassified Fusibacter TaxID=2624464 RepID=UPI001013AE62|nr:MULTISPECIES: glycoside hydrolase family 1 protein [unclassified Fusibacter]MCK8058946.1 glycoside hydrolase family 1 protein [Fusibacter sp. A2]NPE22022.1 glycoside hydrolase family 1 protein [Fusibacter sp. A1]RXV61587.1 glycoside hydrolase family 1 protein [Fusibacter sp. A1]
MAFKKNFLWGSASAAYQIEGAYDEGGKGPSIWDEWAHLPGKTFEGTNGDIACDHYHRYKEDIALMAEMGLKTYRFSIAWARILPEGSGRINQEGIDFYSNLIDELLANDIVPMVTLYHWDLPKSLQDRYLGWESRQIIEDFVAYATVCFEHYSDRVKHWIVMNEPNIFTGLGYMLKLHPPGVQDEERYLKAFHHTVLAHAHTVLAFKNAGYEGMIGSSIAYSPSHAASNTPEDIEAQTMYDATGPDWYLDSYYKGVYPERAVQYYSEKGVMPEVSEDDYRAMKNSAELCDFIGINYYQTSMVAYNPVDGVGFGGMNTSGKKGTQSENGVPGLYKHVRNESLDYTDWDWAIDPDGLRMGLERLHHRYNLPIIISENGLGAYDTVEENGEINDDYRIDFLKRHIIACQQAVDHGVELLAYCTWSFTDLLSWLNGYKKRYGFVHVDIESGSLKRTKKKSFDWYKNVIATGGDIGRL